MPTEQTAARKGRRLRIARDSWVAVVIFLAPAVLVLALFVVYPIGFTFVRSFYGRLGDTFVGLDNFVRIFTQPRTLIALRNNAIWVLVVPVLVTSIGLVLSVLSERVRWTVAFRVFVFMPLVVSGLAAGVTFRFVYAHNPDVGAANAAIGTVIEVFEPPGDYAGARPSVPERVTEANGGFVSADKVSPGENALFGFVAIAPRQVPDHSTEAPLELTAAEDEIRGVVWLDFTPGGGGTRGAIDPGQQGLPDFRVALSKDGRTVARTTTEPTGVFVFDDLDPGEYSIVFEERNFREPFRGLAWLGPGLIMGALIASYVWINTGFALIIIGAGLAGINRDYLDSARVEGANEWQVLTRVTVPLLRQSLMVVLVTTTISVLKIFDLVIVIAPESVQAHATVLALEMWRASFGGARDFGLGSALAIILFLLIIPAMVLNIRRFRLED